MCTAAPSMASNLKILWINQKENSSLWNNYIKTKIRKQQRLTECIVIATINITTKNSLFLTEQSYDFVLFFYARTQKKKACPVTLF